MVTVVRLSTCVGTSTLIMWIRIEEPLTQVTTYPQNNPPSGKLVHLAIPVRWSLIGQEGRGSVESACTYDIHTQGARLVGSRHARTGDRVLVERGRNKAVCQVVWAADPSSELRGQFSVRCIDGRIPWDEELRQAEEQYQPMDLERGRRHLLRHATGRLQIEGNRRRRSRFHAEGQARMVGVAQRMDGEVQQLSEFGARIATSGVLHPGTDFRLTLSMCDVDVAIKAQVKYMGKNFGIGVEFQEIRRGDRPLLNYVLREVRTKRASEFVEVEVVTEALASAAG